MVRSLLTRCLLLAVASVAIYNLWAYCCGRCVLADLLNPGPAGVAMTVAAALAGGALLLLKGCRIRQIRRHRCSCGAFPGPEWAFCCRCGRRR